MKKIFKSKGFTVGVLSVSCLAILIACFWVSREPKADFLPDEPPPNAVQKEWVDTLKPVTESSQSRKDDNSSNQGNASGKQEEYPKVANESEQEVIIDFTSTDTTEETAPPPPEGKTVIGVPEEEHSLVPASETEPSSNDTKKESIPSAGSTNEKGAVYDPVFGWVVPGQVNQISVDSGGDPNKMVGNMGN